MAIPKNVMKAPSEVLPFNDPRIKWPQYASIKYDGFRLLNLCGERFLSPALKDFPNANLHLKFKAFWRHCQANSLVTDGEIWSPELTFQQLQSVIRSKFEPIPDSVEYYVFDVMTDHEWNMESESAYHVRFGQTIEHCRGFLGINIVNQWKLDNSTQADILFEKVVADGHEGLILRSPYAQYKHGRATKNESAMYKFKQFDTCDARIICVNPRMAMKQDIERTRDLTGKLARVFAKDHFTEVPAVGSFTVDCNGTQFNISPGRGFTLADRYQWWQQYNENPNSFIGKHVEFKFMPHGTKDRPRIGSLVRFRPDKDALAEEHCSIVCKHCGVFHHPPLLMCTCECCLNDRGMETL